MINRINLKNLCITLLLFMALFRLYIFSNNDFIIISIFLSIILIILVRPTIEIIKQNIIPIILSLIIFLSTFLSGISTYNFLNGMHYCLRFLALFLVTSSIIKKYSLKECIKNYYFVSLLFCCAMDLSVLVGLEFDPTRYQNLSSYLFGNKFILSYLHMQTFGLMIFYNNLNNKTSIYKYIIYFIVSIVMCRIANCMTGIVGILIFSLMMFLPISPKLKKQFANPKALFLLLILIELLIIEFRLLYDTDFVQYIIKDILNKGNSLNGRYIIYGLLKPLILDKFLLGYGYNATIITRVLGYGNAQNGLFQCLLDFGIVGTTVFLINWYRSINIKFDIKNWPLYGLLYSFIICSSFEVSFKFNFYIILTILLNIGFLQKKYK